MLTNSFVIYIFILQKESKDTVGILRVEIEDLMEKFNIKTSELEEVLMKNQDLESQVLILNMELVEKSNMVITLNQKILFLKGSTSKIQSEACESISDSDVQQKQPQSNGSLSLSKLVSSSGVTKTKSTFSAPIDDDSDDEEEDDENTTTTKTTTTTTINTTSTAITEIPVGSADSTELKLKQLEDVTHLELNNIKIDKVRENNNKEQIRLQQEKEEKLKSIQQQEQQTLRQLNNDLQLRLQTVLLNTQIQLQQPQQQSTLVSPPVCVQAVSNIQQQQLLEQQALQQHALQQQALLQEQQVPLAQPNQLQQFTIELYQRCFAISGLGVAIPMNVLPFTPRSLVFNGKLGKQLDSAPTNRNHSKNMEDGWRGFKKNSGIRNNRISNFRKEIVNQTLAMSRERLNNVPGCPFNPLLVFPRTVVQAQEALPQVSDVQAQPQTQETVSEVDVPNVQEEQPRLPVSSETSQQHRTNTTDEEEENFNNFFSTQEVPEGTNEITFVDESISNPNSELVINVDDDSDSDEEEEVVVVENEDEEKI
ncbi:glutamine-asparagine rich protein [Tieghemostelium lacteum]|uniref:Glutamine-asparagine rich protein n=1 Tax=Tieghemostelium lacteum TaxID=361077 RepID=A0A151ZB66_TIELA|nr:glutamine-asparagine rich protein [Tieghemostelium lacteum]|eukprot:KYQ91178.1 glutamine-asparagine rich protein [Tieghemostelium lacteum]